ncbi:glycoprotein 3-alpha-L-fucosyltransferase A-like [Asterias rubens]|uniref:glycoprotein 3-alpha-L-fucosyltransferase A-like n=1 Tax=Asterias rubens TaxID=7604 RepID=UPI0014554BF6|nr:glycoprotein 3-alpha-L-fucosyltransferase A-like [Asterias rubens]
MCISVRNRRKIFVGLLLAAPLLVCSFWLLYTTPTLNKAKGPRISRQESLPNDVLKNPASSLMYQTNASQKAEKPKELTKEPSGKTVPPKRTVTVKETLSTKETVPVKPTTCEKRIAIFKPSPGFRHWREFGDLDDRFNRAKKHNPSKTPITFRLQCPEQQCEVEVIATLRHDLLEECDGIIVNLDKLPNAPRLQKGALTALTDKTKWFLFAIESADRYHHWLNKDFTEIMFQYSMTYHSESEVPHPYSRYVPNKPMNTEMRNWSEGKSGLVAWMSSSCGDAPWPRFAYAKKLQTLLPIDMYGKCGTLHCGEFLSGKPSYMNAPCMKTLGKYKFYLALENTECDEYITEKFWDNSLRAGTVPIVYGGSREAYKRVAPPNSFIHISDFASMEKLAEYIRYLDKNDDKYNEYFAWRNKGHIELVYPPLNVSDFMCRMVPLMNDDPVPFRKVKDTEMFHSCIHKPMVGKGVPLENWEPRT